jgi:hypothetical protein
MKIVKDCISEKINQYKIEDNENMMLDNNQVEPVFIVVPSKCICSYGDAILYMYQLNTIALSSTEFVYVTFHYFDASN